MNSPLVSLPAASGILAFCLASWLAPLEGAELKSLRLGFQNVGRVGNLLPVTAEVSGLPAGDTVQLEVTASDPRGNLCTDLVAVGTADSQGNVILQGTFATGRLDGTLQVAVRTQVSPESAESSASQPLAERTVVVSERLPVPVSDSATATKEDIPEVADRLQLLRQSAVSVLTSGEIAGVQRLEVEAQRSFGRNVGLVVLREDSLRDLPITRQGLDCVDILLLADSFELSAAQFQALREWVVTGGHLLVSSGATIESFQSSVVGKWLKPWFELAEKPLSVRDLAALQNYVTGAVQLDTQRRIVPMAQIQSDQVQVLVRSLDGPVVARRAVGSGMVTFVAVDLNQRPLNAWQSIDRLYMMLVFGTLLKTDQPAARRGSRISSSGVSDLSTQMAMSFDAIPPSERWSSWQVMALIAVYLVVIGPIDYLLVVHFLKTPRLTWVTFPLLVISGCGLIWMNSTGASSEFVQRQVHVLDVCSADGHQILHGQSWASISATRTRRADISADPVPPPSGFQNAGTTLHWHGRFEDVYGGMYRTGGAGLGREVYRRQADGSGTPAKFVGVPMLASGSQSFSCESLLEGPENSLFESRLTVSGSGLLEGDVISAWPEPIRDWVVFFGARVYQPIATATDEQRAIRSGQTWNRRDPYVRASDLKAFLNGTRIVSMGKTNRGTQKGDSMQVTTPYNVRGTDLLEIMTMASLFEIAGGEAYAGLNSDAFRRSELSDSIRTNYALLMGRVDSPLADFRVDGHPADPISTQTIIRVLLPVARQEEAPSASPKPEPDAALPEEGAPRALAPSDPSAGNSSASPPTL